MHGLAGGVVEWLAPQPGERILDLGCGDGQLTLRLAATGARMHGVDASSEMAAAARARGLAVDVAAPSRCLTPMRSLTPSSPTPRFTGSAITMP